MSDPTLVESLGGEASDDDIFRQETYFYAVNGRSIKVNQFSRRLSNGQWSLHNFDVSAWSDQAGWVSVVRLDPAEVTDSDMAAQFALTVLPAVTR